MIETTRFDDVTACRLSWRRSALVNIPVYVYMVRGVLIDTGFSGVARDMVSLLTEQRLRGAFLTHAHEDHAGNIELVVRAGVPVGLSPETLSLVSHPGPIGFYRRFTWGALAPLVSTLRAFSDEQLSLVPAPGHSPDHHVVWDDATGTLFAGDLFLGVKVRVAHPYEDPRRLVSSLRTFAARAPKRVFCAHRGLVPGGSEALNAKADWLEEIIARLDALIDQGKDNTEMRRRVLGARPFAHWFSRGDYSPDNLVQAVRASHAAVRH